MRTSIIFLITLLAFPSLSFAGGMEDDPVLAKLIVGQFEIRSADGSKPLVWDAEGWIGKDLNKFWFKTEGQFVDDKFEKVELQGLYSRAIAPYWGLQVGARRDFYQKPGHHAETGSYWASRG